MATLTAAERTALIRDILAVIPRGPRGATGEDSVVPGPPGGLTAPVDAADIADGTVSDAEFQRLNGVTSAIQTQLDAKQASDVDLTALAGVSETEGFYRKSGAGTCVVVKSNLGAGAAPALTDDSDDGYSVGSMWLDTTAKKAYLALGVNVAAADWVCIGDFALTATEIGYLATVTSNVQTQLSGKVDNTVAVVSTRLEVPTIGTSSGQQHSIPDGTDALVTLGATQTLTAKTLTSPAVNAPVLGGTAGAPTADVVMQGAVDINGAGTAARKEVFEGGGYLTEWVDPNSDMKVMHIARAFDDDAEIQLPTPTAVGHLDIYNYNGHFAEHVIIGPSGDVSTFGDVSANFATTDSDTKLCVYSSAAIARVKNRLGSSQVLLGTYRWK